MKKKIFSIMILIILVVTIMTPLTKVCGFSVSDMSGTTSDIGEVENWGQSIIKVLTTVGSICSVAVLVALGIKYMMGSTEEKAEYKKTLLPYIIGAALVFGASSIASIIYNIAIDL